MSKGLLEEMYLEGYIVMMALGYEFIIENGHATEMRKAELEGVM